jgi:hypothetical protein
MSNEDASHAPGWIKTGEAAGPDGVVQETGHVEGVRVTPVEPQPLSAADTETSDAAGLRGESFLTQGQREYVGSGQFMRDWEAGKLGKDQTVSAANSSCEVRKSLGILTSALYAQILPLSEAIREALQDARAALSTPCPCEGLQEDCERLQGLLAAEYGRTQDLQAECDRLRAELAKAIEGQNILGTEIANLRVDLTASQERERVLRADRDRLEWLNEEIVNVIDLDDGRIIDVRGLDVRKAIDAARALTPEEQK